jgi:hypothetical protein
MNKFPIPQGPVLDWSIINIKEVDSQVPEETGGSGKPENDAESNSGIQKNR